jgi:hypothetical protein
MLLKIVIFASMAYSDIEWYCKQFFMIKIYLLYYKIEKQDYSEIKVELYRIWFFKI